MEDYSYKMFKLSQVKDKGKDAFACAYGTKCINRCPRLRARIECQKRRGLCPKAEEGEKRGECGGVYLTPPEVGAKEKKRIDEGTTRDRDLML